eukprot:8269890-Alexandrium_andersonii.AAC.1
MLEFMRSIASGWAQADALDKKVFALWLGSDPTWRMPRLCDLLPRHSECSALGMGGADRSSVEFDFQPEVSAASSAAHAADVAPVEAHPEHEKVLFFCVQHLRPSRHHVVRGASKVTGEEHMAFARLHLVHVLSDAVRVTAELGGRATDTSDDIFLLTPRMLNHSVLSRVVVFDVPDRNYYEFGHPIPLAMQETLQALVRRFLHSSELEVAADAMSADEAECMSLLAELGFVGQRLDAGGVHMWYLLERGRSNISVLSELSSPSKFFAVRPGVPLPDLSAFELHELLVADGWACRVKGPKDKCPDYKDGDSN